MTQHAVFCHSKHSKLIGAVSDPIRNKEVTWRAGVCEIDGAILTVRPGAGAGDDGFGV